MGQDEAGAPEHGGETPQCADVEVSKRAQTAVKVNAVNTSQEFSAIRGPQR